MSFYCSTLYGCGLNVIHLVNKEKVKTSSNLKPSSYEQLGIVWLLEAAEDQRIY